MRWPLTIMLTLVAASLGGAEPLIVAHRGASHDAPENTLAAFRLAWKQGADAIEGDFYLTADGRIACLHDATTKRTAGTNVAVAKATLGELRRLDVGRWKGPQWIGERIPTLQEVLATVPPGKQIFIELKSGPEIVPAFQTVIHAAGLRPEQTVVISFNADVIAAVREQLPALKAYWLTGYKKDPKTGGWKPGLPEILETLRRIRAHGLDSQAHESIGEPFVQALRAAQYPLHVWTVDEPEVALRFARLGAVSITTNRPEWLRQELARLRSPGH